MCHDPHCGDGPHARQRIAKFLGAKPQVRKSHLASAEHCSTGPASPAWSLREPSDLSGLDPNDPLSVNLYTHFWGVKLSFWGMADFYFRQLFVKISCVDVYNNWNYKTLLKPCWFIFCLQSFYVQSFYVRSFHVRSFYVRSRFPFHEINLR